MEGAKRAKRRLRRDRCDRRRGARERTAKRDPRPVGRMRAVAEPKDRRSIS